MVTVELKPVITTMMTTAKACEVAHEVEVSTHAVGRVGSTHSGASEPPGRHGRGITVAEEKREEPEERSFRQSSQGALPLESEAVS